MAWWRHEYIHLFCLRKQPDNRHIMLVGFDNFMRFPRSVLDKAVDWEGVHQQNRVAYGDQSGIPLEQDRKKRKNKK